MSTAPTATATSNAFAAEWHKDRATLKRAVRGLKPASTKGNVKTYHAHEVIDALISAAVRGATGDSADGNKSLGFTQERTAKLKAQRIAIERENEITSGKYVLTEEVGREVENAFLIVRENMLGIPHTIADQIATASRAAKSQEAARTIAADTITEAIREVLEALSSPDEMELSDAHHTLGSVYKVKS
jgi:uncharacterized protein with beta-barrel porin domain